MLTEVHNVRQEPGGFRRIFTDEQMDLYLWYGHERGGLIGFQLCYDKLTAQHAVTWRKDQGYRHNKIDDGEGHIGRHKGAAILIPDGIFDKDRVTQAFRAAAGLFDGDERPRTVAGRRVLERSTAEFIAQKLAEFEESERATLTEGPPAPTESSSAEGLDGEGTPARKVQLEELRDHEWSWLPRYGDQEHVNHVGLVCTKHPSLEGAYPVKMVIDSRWLMFLATDWGGFQPEKAAALALGALDRFLPRSRLEALDITALENEGSISIPLERIRSVAGDEAESSFSVEFEDPSGEARTCRFFSLRYWQLALKSVELAIDKEGNPEGDADLVAMLLRPAPRQNPMLRLSKLVCERCYAMYHRELEEEGLQREGEEAATRSGGELCSICGRVGSKKSEGPIAPPPDASPAGGSEKSDEAPAGRATRQGDVLDGRYELERVLRSERLGIVWRARHLQTGRRVAIKRIRPEHQGRQDISSRLLREARIASLVSTDHAVLPLDLAAMSEGETYLVTELVDGELLDELVHREGPLELGRAVGLARQLCRGMHAFHEEGVIHRHLHPGGLLVARDSEGGEALRILDLGLACFMGSPDESDPSVVIGRWVTATPYSAPELVTADRALDRRVDVYSAGAILYELLTGHVPFSATATRLLVEQITRSPFAPIGALRSGLPEKLKAVVEKATAKDRDRRYESMNELFDALASIGI